MSNLVFCTATPGQAEIIIARLQSEGFLSSDISILMANTQETRDFAVEHQTRAPQGAVAGAGTGVAVGGVIGWLAGIGTLVLPGLGALLAAGPIMAALSGAAIGGAAGGLVGALAGMGISEIEAEKYEGRVRSGRALITVHSDYADAVRRAREIFEDAGAEDISIARDSAPITTRRPR